MKKLITIFFLFGLAYGQLPLNRGPVGIHERDARLQAYLNLVIPVYSDTTTANLNKGLDSLGAFIQLRSTGIVYHRDTSANTHKWSTVGISDVITPFNNTLAVISVNSKGQVINALPAALGDIAGALGYTPYDAANPAGYITAAQIRSTYLRNGLHARNDSTLVLGTIPGNLTDTSTVFDFNNNFFGFKGVPIQASVPADYYLIIEDTTNHTLKHIKPISLGISGNPFADNSALVKNNSDNTKLLILSAASITTGTTRTWTFPDVNGTVARNDAAQTFTGVQTFSSSPIIPTPSASDNSTKAASTAYVDAADNLKANLASPTFTGSPVLPTGTTGITQSPIDNSTKLATTAYVDRDEFWLVQPTTASGVASIAIDFSSVFNTVSRIEIYLTGIVPATDNKELQMQVSTDGITYDGGAGAYTFATAGLGSSSSTASNNVSASQTYMSLGLGYGNATAKSNHCIIKLYANGVSARNVTYGFEAHYITSAGSTAVAIGSMSHNTASIEKFVKIFFPSANISVDSYSVKCFK